MPRLYYSFIFCFIISQIHVGHAQTAVRVDDSYAYSRLNYGGIQYTGTDWTPGPSADSKEHYNGTFTQTDVHGASLVFFFRGSSINYLADLGPNFGTVYYSIDNLLADTFSGYNNETQSQWLTWRWIGLDSGDHQVIISNYHDRLDVPNSMTGLDFFSIFPYDDRDGIEPMTLGPGAKAVPPGAVIVDDQDPSIVYEGEWSLLGSAPRTAIYFQDTMHSTKTAGDSCTFTFTGTSVYYFTDYFSGNAAVDISIDGGPAEPVLTASAGQAGLTQRLTWSMTGLSDGTHTVKITHAGEGNYASVDFFMYMPSGGAAATSSATSSTSSSSSTPTSNASTTITQTILDNAHLLPIGAIIGGVVGIVAIIALFAAFLIWMRYRRSLPVPPAKDQSVPLTSQIPGIGIQSPSGKPGAQTYFDQTRIYQAT